MEQVKADWWNPFSWYLDFHYNDTAATIPASSIQPVGGGAAQQPLPWWLDAMLIAGATVAVVYLGKAIIDKKL